MNPNVLAGPVRSVWTETVRTVHSRLAPAGYLETRGDGGDVERVARWVDATRPEVVVAGGGDGTVSDVVAALMHQAPEARPSLGILPLGTANNVARSLGLTSVRTGGSAAVDITIAAVGAGSGRPLDIGRVNERYFVGSLAVGMDADILALRNRLRRRFQLGRRLGGYPLYLWSCAVSALRRGHGARTHLTLDGVETARRLYNLLLTNTALYAGEFMFDTMDRSDDGLLDLHAFADRRSYIVRFVRAWRRRVAYARGRPIVPDTMQRVRTVDLTLARPLPVQIDGEEYGPTTRLEICVQPCALSVRVPSASIRQRERDGVTAGERAYG